MVSEGVPDCFVLKRVKCHLEVYRCHPHICSPLSAFRGFEFVRHEVVRCSGNAPRRVVDDGNSGATPSTPMSISHEASGSASSRSAMSRISLRHGQSVFFGTASVTFSYSTCVSKMSSPSASVSGKWSKPTPDASADKSRQQWPPSPTRKRHWTRRMHILTQKKLRRWTCSQRRVILVQVHPSFTFQSSQDHCCRLANISNHSLSIVKIGPESLSIGGAHIQASPQTSANFAP